MNKTPEKKNKWRGKLVVLGLLLAGILLYLAVPAIRNAINMW